MSRIHFFSSLQHASVICLLIEHLFLCLACVVWLWKKKKRRSKHDCKAVSVAIIINVGGACITIRRRRAGEREGDWGLGRSLIPDRGLLFCLYWNKITGRRSSAAVCITTQRHGVRIIWEGREGVCCTLILMGWGQPELNRQRICKSCNACRAWLYEWVQVSHSSAGNNAHTHTPIPVCQWRTSDFIEVNANPFERLSAKGLSWQK